LNSDWYGARAIRWVAQETPDADIAICSSQLYLVDIPLKVDLSVYAERLNFFQPFFALPHVRISSFLLKGEGYDVDNPYLLPQW